MLARPTATRPRAAEPPPCAALDTQATTPARTAHAKALHKCANCKENHSAGYGGCKVYKEAISITKVASDLRISYAGAVKLFEREK